MLVIITSNSTCVQQPPKKKKNVCLNIIFHLNRIILAFISIVEIFIKLYFF